MITYTYKCNKCEKVFEEKQKITDSKLTDCKYCDSKDTLERVILPEGGFSLRGNWFSTTQGY